MTDWAASASATFAGAGLIFAGVQIRMMRSRAVEDHRVALDGVAVSWQALESPVRDNPTIPAQWRYRFVATNPGRLPIDDVVIDVHFPCDVQRIRYTGQRGDASRVVKLRTPVLTGGGSHEWTRRLWMCPEEGSLDRTYAEISFRDVNLEPKTNRWPRLETDRVPDSED